jgi:hypothetical protein
MATGSQVWKTAPNPVENMAAQRVAGGQQRMVKAVGGVVNHCGPNSRAGSQLGRVKGLKTLDDPGSPETAPRAPADAVHTVRLTTVQHGSTRPHREACRTVWSTAG